MLRQSFTWVYDRYITEASTEVQETYRKAQEEAKAEQRGLWSDPNSIPPWILRRICLTFCAGARRLCPQRAVQNARTRGDTRKALVLGWVGAHTEAQHLVNGLCKPA